MSIILENITKRFGQQPVVTNVSLEIGNGEFFVLLGSSGSGKTTILNIVAGLVSADQGRVLLHGRDVTGLPTQQRNVGYVFQNYALFEYMTVAENIEFGLKIRKVPAKQRQLKRDSLLELVGLVGLSDRLPRQLSGGQQQRVALARALALEPDVLLLDEPLGALDAKIRAELRRSLKAIQKQLGVAAILVTHDQEEAFDLADRIGVMSYGRLVEVGTPRDLYMRPQTEFVASFLGSANILLGMTNGQKIQIGPNIFGFDKEAARFSPDGRVQVLFRPEDLDLAGRETDLDGIPLGEGVVTSLGFNGPSERIRLEIPAIPGVRAIAPSIPFGTQNIVIDASRPPEQAAAFPLSISDRAWVGIRRVHALSHPGLSFLVVTDGSLRSESALNIGGYLARMSHARATLLGTRPERPLSESYLLKARKLMGNGMASLQVQTDRAPIPEAIAKSVEQEPVDLVVAGWRPVQGVAFAEDILRAGDHHLLLAAHPSARFENALVCVAGGEPGKDDVMFAGRLLRHLGVQAKLLTVVSRGDDVEHQRPQIEKFVEGGTHSLEMFGVPTLNEIRIGHPQTEIVEEMWKGHYDLVILGAPLPDRNGYVMVTPVVETVMRNARNCSLLIVRSHYSRRPRRHG